MLGIEGGEEIGDFPAHGGKVQRLLLGFIGNAEAAADVEEFETDAEFLLDQGRDLQEHAGGFHHVGVIQLVGGDHGVQAEALGAPCLGAAVGVHHLLMGDAVFGLFGMADDDVAGTARPGIVAEADQLGEFGDLVDQADIVEIEDAAAVLGRKGEFLGAGIVRGEHDLLGLGPDLAGKNQLGDGAAVEAEAHLLHQAQNAAIGQGLNGEILAEAGNAGKGFFELLSRFANARFVIDMEGGAVMGGDVADHREEAGFESFGHGHSGHSPEKRKVPVKERKGL